MLFISFLFYTSIPQFQSEILRLSFWYFTDNSCNAEPLLALLHSFITTFNEVKAVNTSFPTENHVKSPSSVEHTPVHCRISRCELIIRTRWLLVLFVSCGQGPIDVRPPKKVVVEKVKPKGTWWGAWRPLWSSSSSGYSEGAGPPKGQTHKSRHVHDTPTEMHTHTLRRFDLSRARPGPLVPFSAPRFIFTTGDLPRKERNVHFYCSPWGNSSLHLTYP